MRDGIAIAALAAGEGREKRGDAAAEIYGKTENCAQLDDDRIHLPVTVGEADMQQRFRQSQMRGGTDGEKFGEAFHNAQNQGEQVVVQTSSENKQTVSQKITAARLQEVLFRDVAVGGDALLDVEDQALGAESIVALAILADDSLRQPERTILRFRGFFLIWFGPVDLDEGGAPPGCVVQGFGGGRRLRMIFRVILVEVGFFIGTFRQAFPLAAKLVVDHAESG